MIPTRKIALASALALAVIAPITIAGCDSNSPTATVVVTSTATTGTATNPTPVGTVEQAVPSAQGTAGPQAVSTSAATVSPNLTPTAVK